MVLTKVTMSSGNSLNPSVTSPSNGTISIGGAAVTVRPSYQITYFRQATYQSESNRGIYRIIFNHVDDTTFNTIQTTLTNMYGQYLTITYADYENNIQFIYSGTLMSNGNPIYKGSSVSNTVGFIFNSTPTLTNVNGTGDLLISTDSYSEYFGSSSNSIIPTGTSGHVYISY